jgi:GntR family transcriptional regulator/MocR family aminotransferase
VTAAGVAVRLLTDYTHARAEHDGGDEDGAVRLVLGYAHLSPARIRDGIRLMAGAVES